MSLGANLIHHCTIQRPAKAQDAYGNVKRLYGPYTSGVLCRLVEKSQRIVKSETADLAPVTTYSLLVLPDVDLQVEDRITELLYEDGTLDARTFEVLSIVLRRTKSEHHRRAELMVVGAPSNG